MKTETNTLAKTRNTNTAAHDEIKTLPKAKDVNRDVRIFTQRRKCPVG